MKAQYWGEDEIKLWSSRLAPWIAKFGARNVEAVTDWAIDNQNDLADRKIDIATFRVKLDNSTPQVSTDGPLTMCLLCENTGYYAIEPSNDRSRHTRCHHPPDKQQRGWYRRQSINIPPGESLESMRENYHTFWTDAKKLQKKTMMGPKRAKKLPTAAFEPTAPR